jgi:4-amino-4-deoxy-L-arabinose transferase-like glycosyltransferase
MNSSLSRSAAWFVIFLIGVIWFMLPGYRDLAEPDEGRYAEIPREMVASGDWVTPRLNGFKYFEKPALQYWMTAATFKLFGESNATARLWVIAAGFAGALWMMFVAGRLWGREVGYYAFLILSSSLLYVVLGHLLILDMTLSVFMAGALGAVLIAQSRRDSSTQVRNWMLLAWLMTGLAVLSKGLVGIVLPGAAIVIYSLWQRDWALWKHLHLGKGVLLILLVTAPWFIMVSIANPEFAEFFFIHEHFDRYTSDVHGREEPLWYFLPVLLLGLFPWIWSGMRALLRPGFQWRPQKSAGFDAERLLWTYVVFMFLFFSLGRSMLAPYLLPLFAPLALLMARQLKSDANVNMVAWPLIGFGALLVGASFFAEQFATQKVSVEHINSFRNWALPAALVMIAGGLAARYLFAARGVKAVTVLAVAALLSMQLLMLGYQHLGEYRSSKKLADVLQPYVDADTIVYSVGIYPQSLPFYLRRMLQLAIRTSELEMGIHQEPEKWIPDMQSFRARWLQEKGQSVAVFRRKDYQRLKSDGLPMLLIYEDATKVAVIRSLSENKKPTAETPFWPDFPSIIVK